MNMGPGYYAGMETTYSKRITELMTENARLLKQVERLRECINYWIDAERLRQEGKPVPMDYLGKLTKSALEGEK